MCYTYIVQLLLFIRTKQNIFDMFLKLFSNFQKGLVLRMLLSLVGNITKQ